MSDGNEKDEKQESENSSEPEPKDSKGLGDDDEFDFPMFCVDVKGIAVLIAVVSVISLLVWKMILR